MDPKETEEKELTYEELEKVVSGGKGNRVDVGGGSSSNSTAVAVAAGGRRR